MTLKPTFLETAPAAPVETETTRWLRDARALLTTVGWGQGKEVVCSSDGAIVGYCALGAAARASTGNASYPPPAQVSTLLNAALPADFPSAASKPLARVVLWNDTPGRKREEVLALFDQAIQLSKEGLA